MDYPDGFFDDMRYLAERYQWSDADKAEIRASFVNNPEGVAYYRTLAAAYRAGYVQDAANGYCRLQPWCIVLGYGDPFAPGFDLAALQARAITQVAA